MALDCTTAIRVRYSAVLAVVIAGTGLLVSAARGQDALQENTERLSKMSADEKAALSKKKQRFDELPPAERERLRELHVSIAQDPQAQELAGTVRRYNQWLANLGLSDRTAILDEKDPEKRIARIKELVHAQEERRFGEFIRGFVEKLEPEDKDAFYKWFGDFVERHKELLIKRMPDDIRRRYKDADESAGRRYLMGSWSYQYRERENDTPVPSAEDLDQLIAALSPEARKPFAAPELRQTRVITFMRAAVFSRTAPQVSKDELEKFYHKMPKDDQRRAALENLDGDTLLRELQKLWNVERWRERTGPGGGRGGPPPGPRPEGRSRPDDPRPDRSPGGKRPPE